MSEAITRVTLFVPGTPTSMDGWRDALAGADCTAEWIANDGHFGEAFGFGTVAPELVARIDRAPGALVLLWPADLRTGRAAIVAAVTRLRDAGALAVRLEESKLGWDVDTWLELFGADDPWAWHRGAVAFLRDADALHSIGMHAFALPDVRIALDGDPAALQALATSLDLFQLIEDPPLQSGHTFAPDAATPRRVIERWPAVEYPPDHPCHNPYGAWHLGPPGGVARSTGAQAFVFVPALRAILAAAEAQAETPLTRAEVEAIRDRAACMTMSVADAQRLERGRGYADLDPELVWPQWQLVRGSLPG